MDKVNPKHVLQTLILGIISDFQVMFASLAISMLFYLPASSCQRISRQGTKNQPDI